MIGAINTTLAGCGKGTPRLRFFRSPWFCDWGRVFGCIRWCPADSFSVLRANCELGLRGLNRQIPHAD